MKYPMVLPSVTIIIIFHNEHLSTLLRTCISIIQRTPAQLLTEIILVDDASNLNDLGVPLTKYIENTLPMIKLLRIPMRVGLIQARMAGARAAKSDFLVFLDSHCEVYHNWLPPLLGLCLILANCNFKGCNPSVRRWGRTHSPKLELVIAKPVGIHVLFACGLTFALNQKQNSLLLLSAESKYSILIFRCNAE